MIEKLFKLKERGTDFKTEVMAGLTTFMTMIFMVCASSISDGIMLGILSYVVCKAFGGKLKEIKPTTWVVAALFIAKIIVSLL